MTFPQDGDQLQKMEIRLRELEAWRAATDIEDARSEERQKAMRAHNERIELRLAAIENHISKVVWLVASGIVVAFVTFMISGGLTIVP